MLYLEYLNNLMVFEVDGGRIDGIINFMITELCVIYGVCAIMRGANNIYIVNIAIQYML